MKTPINTGIFQSDLEAAGYRISGLPTPAADNEAANKKYVDDNAGGGGGGTNPLITVNVKDAPYSAVGDGVADDTVAINAAIAAVVAAGGGTVFFPRGIYLCNGAFDGTTNSILKVPTVDITTSPMIGIELLGETFSFWGSSNLFTATAHAMIKSTKVGTGTEPALLGCNPFHGYGAVGYNYFNNINLRIKNMVFSVTNPLMNALRLDMAGAALIENVVALGGGFHTASTATGIWMPNTGNFAIAYANNVMATCFGIGVRAGEHFRCPTLMVGSCATGLSFMEANESSWALATFVHCNHMIDFTGTHSVEVHADIENSAPGTGDYYDTTAHIYDPSNYGGGNVRYNLIDATIGYSSNPFLVTGGTKINLMDLHTGDTRIASASKFLIGPDARLTAISGGVKLECRNTGTGTWVEATRFTNP